MPLQPYKLPGNGKEEKKLLDVFSIGFWFSTSISKTEFCQTETEEFNTRFQKFE